MSTHFFDFSIFFSGPRRAPFFPISRDGKDPRQGLEPGLPTGAYYVQGGEGHGVHGPGRRPRRAEAPGGAEADGPPVPLPAEEHHVPREPEERPGPLAAEEGLLLRRAPAGDIDAPRQPGETLTVPGQAEAEAAEELLDQGGAVPPPPQTAPAV